MYLPLKGKSQDDIAGVEEQRLRHTFQISAVFLVSSRDEHGVGIETPYEYGCARQIHGMRKADKRDP